MDLSAYYEDFQLTYNLAVFTFFFTVFVVIFVGIRTIKDKNHSVNTKIIACLLLVIPFAIVLNMSRDTFLAKKDIEQKTIYYYEGSIEITEVSKGIRNTAVFLIDENEMCLKFSEKDDYDCEQIQVGKYEGKIIYAQHVAQVIHLDIKKLEFDQ